MRDEKHHGPPANQIEFRPSTSLPDGSTLQIKLSEVRKQTEIFSENAYILSLVRRKADSTNQIPTEN